ncbi:MAG: hypothetical protein V8S87_02775 [Oscillospiraceae bacterium]
MSKPSAHSMIQNLCDLGLAEKQKYGAVHLTPSRAAKKPPGTLSAAHS